VFCGLAICTVGSWSDSYFDFGEAACSPLVVPLDHMSLKYTITKEWTTIPLIIMEIEGASDIKERIVALRKLS
jgi:hypothetical protein